MKEEGTKRQNPADKWGHKPSALIAAKNSMESGGVLQKNTAECTKFPHESLPVAWRVSTDNWCFSSENQQCVN